MKRTFLLVVALLVIGTSANSFAAPAPIIVKPIILISSAAGAEGLAVTGKIIITYSNTVSSSQDITVIGRDVNGLILWQKVIDSGVDEIASSMAIAANGDIWLAGSSALTALTDTPTVTRTDTPTVTRTDTPTVTSEVISPDGVLIETLTPLRNDMNQTTLWHMNPSGVLLQSFSALNSSPLLISAMSINANGISVVGLQGQNSVLVNATLTGSFSPVFILGSELTLLTGVARNPDATVNVFGSSSESLKGQKTMGVRDGILLKVAKGGKLLSVVRSSALKAKRSWLSTSQTLFLGGDVIAGKKIESALTKFSPTFTPSWTLRVPSTGSTAVIDGPANSYFATFTSTGPIAGIPKWNPKSPTTMILAFSGAGKITAAFSGTEIFSQISMGYSKESGLYILGSTKSDSIIYRVTSR